ncbi:MAG TPA: recombinase family protein, partial [Ruminococcaceae bacterium]|nr:recombinase family protein [Oscillospiraceae bacterium]
MIFFCGNRFVETKTEQGKYSSKYALTELLICGECGTPYRRRTWTSRGQKKIVWRCISRLDYGKKYCKHSPSIEESVLQNAIMDAIMKMAKENADILKTLKSHIAMGLNADSINDNSIELQIRIAEIDAEFSKLITSTNTENENDDDRETLMEKLLTEKNQLKKQLEEIELLKKNKELTMSRLDEIYSTIDLLRNHPLTYDDQIVRDILECVVVESKDKIKVVFKVGIE